MVFNTFIPVMSSVVYANCTLYDIKEEENKSSYQETNKAHENIKKKSKTSSLNQIDSFVENKMNVKLLLQFLSSIVVIKSFFSYKIKVVQLKKVHLTSNGITGSIGNICTFVLFHFVQFSCLRPHPRLNKKEIFPVLDQHQKSLFCWTMFCLKFNFYSQTVRHFLPTSSSTQM